MKYEKRHNILLLLKICKKKEDHRERVTKRPKKFQRKGLQRHKKSITTKMLESFTASMASSLKLRHQRRIRQNLG